MKTILNIPYHVRAVRKPPQCRDRISFCPGANHRLPLHVLTILVIFFTCLPAFAWDFVQERSSIPVSFDGVECQVPWTTGYNYINPTFCDIDGDNDFDLIVGSDWARVTLFLNEGNSNNPNMVLVTDTLVSAPYYVPLSQQPNRTILCDIDNDGDKDLFMGYILDEPFWTGRLSFFENMGDSGIYTFEFVTEYYQGIETNNNPYPVFIDIDNDSDLDLFFGEGPYYSTTAGRICFYRNEGTPENAVMDSVTSYFMNIDIGDECIPSFIDIDNDGDYDMFLGDEDGKIHYYRNDGSPEVYDFTFVTDEYAGVDVANIASPTFTDIDGDGDFDLFVGERSWGQDDRRGDINFYENVGTADSAVFEPVTQNFLSIDIGNMAVVTFADIDNDTLPDMFIGDLDGNINYFSNNGTESHPAFAFETETFEGIAANSQSRPTFGDLDNDGDLDMIAGRVSFNTGSLHLYRNDGTPEIPDYTLITSQYLGAEYVYAAPKNHPKTTRKLPLRKFVTNL